MIVALAKSIYASLQVIYDCNSAFTDANDLRIAMFTLAALMAMLMTTAAFPLAGGVLVGALTAWNPIGLFLILFFLVKPLLEAWTSADSCLDGLAGGGAKP